MLKPMVVFTLTLFGSTTLHAQLPRGPARDTTEIQHYLYLSAGDGGDVLVDPSSGQSLRAGGLAHVAYGLRFSDDQEERVLIDLRIGYKLNLQEKGKTEHSFKRYPLELEAQSRVNEAFGVGFGATYHIDPTFESDDPVFPDQKIRFDDALGWFLSMDYRLTSFTSFGARYTRIKYEKKDTVFLLPGSLEPVTSIDGSGAEFFIIFRFY